MPNHVNGNTYHPYFYNCEEKNKYIESYIPKVRDLAKQLTDDVDMQEELFSSGMLGVTIVCNRYKSMAVPIDQSIYNRILYEMTKTYLISRGSTSIHAYMLSKHDLQDLINGTNLSKIASKLNIEKSYLPNFINSLTYYGSSNYPFMADAESKDLNHDDSLEDLVYGIDIEQIIINLFDQGIFNEEDVRIIFHTFGLYGNQKMSQAEIGRLPEFLVSRSYINSRLKRALKIIRKAIEHSPRSKANKENQPTF